MSTAYMICKTCGKQLDKLTKNGIEYWGHAVELIGKSDHEADPVEYDESILISVCDFCHETVPLDQRHFLPVSDYDILLELEDGQTTSLGNRGGFNACTTCAGHLFANDWDGLVQRYMVLHPGTYADVLNMLWNVVRQHVEGPVRKWRPGDEKSGGDD